MPLSYQEAGDLMVDFAFRSRVKVAVLGFAKYIYGEAPSVPAHNTRMKWAQNAVLNPDTVAAQAQPQTVMEDGVQQDGANISDANLQTAVESALQKLM